MDISITIILHGTSTIGYPYIVHMLISITLNHVSQHNQYFYYFRNDLFRQHRYTTAVGQKTTLSKEHEETVFKTPEKTQAYQTQVYQTQVYNHLQ